MYIKPEPAIYKIENEQTYECYVGGTRDVQARKRNHWYDLRKGRHRNPKLQQAYNSGNTFSFAVLEYLDIGASDDAIVRREQEWHEFLRPAYNGRNAIQKFGSDLELQRERKLAGTSTGRKQPQEEIDRRAASVRLYWETHPPKKMPIEFVEKLKTRMRGDKHPLFGKHHDEDTKNKISDTLARNEYTLLSPDGETVTIRSLKRFSKEHKIWEIYSLVKEEIEVAKGWRFVSKRKIK